MLTAVPAEGYLALRQHRILLCAAPYIFSRLRLPSPLPAFAGGGFLFTVFSAFLSQSARVDASAARFAAGSGRQKTPTAAAVGFGFNHYLRMLPAHGKADDSAAYRR